jgi:uncharacterized protein (DUF1697 family)
VTDWVALLRGVNVGGITIKSADLREVFSSLGFDDVRTVLASGNVTFASDDAEPRRGALKKRIETALRTRFGYDAWILLLTRAEIDAAITGFPFDADDAARQPWVVFCVDDATQKELTDAATALDDDADPVTAGRGVVYWNPVKGTSTDTAFAKVLARTAFKPRTTNRNLRTLVKILG